MVSRKATHAGSWYSQNRKLPSPESLVKRVVASQLSFQLARWLDAVPKEHCAVEGARVIIAPSNPTNTVR